MQNLIIRLVYGIRLRKEYFGGLVYDTRNGNILEVDNSAFHLLNLIKDRALKLNDAITFLIQNNIIKREDKSIDKTLQKLFELRIIEKQNEASSLPQSIIPKPVKITSKPWLSAPETVHWAVTYSCNRDCPDCYTRRFSFIKNELGTTDAMKLIDKIADWGVFQLAIGGGEPLLRKDLLKLVQYAANRGLSVNITTGKLKIDSYLLESLCSSIQNLQFGIQPDDLIGSNLIKTIHQLQDLFITLQKLGITPGANLFLTKSAIKQFEKLIKILADVGFNRIILLRYKPPESIERWESEKPDHYQTKKLHKKIYEIIKENPQLNIRIDCALSFVQRYLSRKLSAQFGIKGCVAADRILALAPDGSVYPCSQLVHPDCYAGNLLESEPTVLWEQSRILRKYRSFRNKKSFKYSWCGVCQARHFCGGCRVFAVDGLGGDTDCPQPVLPKLSKIGKIGRSLDLVEYLKSYNIISVEEYMDRYGVSQRRAIKELNASPYTLSTTGKPVRKKKDTYKQIPECIECHPFLEYLENYPEWIRLKTKDSWFQSKNKEGDGDYEDI